MKQLVRMNRVVALTLALVMAVYALAPVSIAAATNTAQPAGGMLPLEFSFLNPISGVTNTFEGVVNNARFIVEDGNLVLVGNLVGQVTDAAGNVVASINQAIRTTLLSATGTCEILDLVLGPINLDLLGLVVTTNQIEVNITAESGPGNLLGNLLCAVAGLLDRGGPLTGIAGLLNNILRRLNLG